MRERTENILMWSLAIWWVWVAPLLRQYLIYSGIVFNVFLIILLIWGR